MDTGAEISILNRHSSREVECQEDHRVVVSTVVGEAELPVSKPLLVEIEGETREVEFAMSPNEMIPNLLSLSDMSKFNATRFKRFAGYVSSSSRIDELWLNTGIGM